MKPKKSPLFAFCHKKKLRGVGKVYPVRCQGWKRLVFKTEKGEMAGLRDLHLSNFSGDWLKGENNATKASEGTLSNTMNCFVVNGYQFFSLWLFLCIFHKRGHLFGFRFRKIFSRLNCHVILISFDVTNVDLTWLDLVCCL